MNTITEADDPRYVGCYSYSDQDKVLTLNIAEPSSGYSISACVLECGRLSFSYAGLQVYFCKLNFKVYNFNFMSTYMYISILTLSQGVTGNGHCYCSNSSYDKSADCSTLGCSCDTPCKNQPDTFCGGNLSTSVYTTGIFSN